MSRALRSACLFAFVSTLAVLSVPGCSQQAEGERCDSTNGDTDCNDGLACIPKAKLLENITDRCCPAENTETDSRCHRVGSAGIPTGPSGGTTSTAGSSSGGAPGGDSSGGMSTLPESGGAAGTTNSIEGGSSNSSAGTPATPNGGAGASSASGGAGAGGTP